MDLPPSNTPNAEQVALVQKLFLQHAPELRGFVLALVVDFTAIDDVIQETFLVVTRKAADFRPNSDFAAWVATIARFEARTIMRKGRKLDLFSEEVLDALCASRPERPSHRDRHLQHLADCMGRLAPQARQAVELRYQEGHKPGEVARRMHWTAEAVYVALSRARTALRQCVEQKLAEEGA